MIQKATIHNFIYSIFSKILSPKLSRLSIYSPRPMRIPARYRETPPLSSYPTISIVTPSYNQGAFIGRTMQSVIDQKYPNLEYAVQDGASNDNTVDVIKAYQSHLHYWESKPDTGQANAINRGFGHTGGEIMAWLNSDDLLLPGTLHYVARYFNEHPEADAIYGHRVLIDERDMEVGRWVIPPHDDEVLRWVDFVPQETLFWRRHIWEDAGGELDESFDFALDWDLLLKFQAAGARIVRVPRFLGAFRVHSQQKTSANISDVGIHEMNRLRERLHGRAVDDKETFIHIRPYLIKHIVLQYLYDFGMIRY